MKTLCSAVLLSLSVWVLPVSANAGMTGGGYVPSQSRVISVSQAAKLGDNSPVVMEGFITQSLTHDVYEFKDDTGVVRVKIDNGKWNGLKVSAETRVRIAGHVDNNLLTKEINVDSITLAGNGQ